MRLVDRSGRALVGVTVMGVRKVSVAVLQRSVAVRVLVRDARRNVCRVRVAVMFVVFVRVIVFDFIVSMRMLMTLAQM